MPSYTMILVADLKDSQPITPRSHKLYMIFDAPFDESDKTFELKPLDDFRVLVVVLPGPAQGDVVIRGLNMASWRSVRERRPTGQRIFGNMFRDSADTPDRQIMAMGDARFGPLTGFALPTESTLPAAELRSDDPALSAFEMKVPSRLVLVRPGLFAFLISLAVQVGDGPICNFIIDPEVDVGGTYPPDDGG